jgi:hypothetical protein
MCRYILILASISLATLLVSAEAHASRVDKIMQEGESFCEQLARQRGGDPDKLRSVRKVLERLADEQRRAARVAQEASKAQDAARRAHEKYLALEQKLARDCKGKHGPICALTRARAESAHKKSNRLAEEMRAANQANNTAQRGLDTMASAALQFLRSQGSTYRR